MPTAQIDYSRAHQILNNPGISEPHIQEDGIISTPYGLSILEIQGELNLPTHAPPPEHENKEYLQNFITVDDAYHAVRCGNLEYDSSDPKKVTLFIGKSQRLLGSLVDLDTPLAVLRVPLNNESIDEQDEKIQIVDVIHKKMTFKQRPLPIM